MAASISSFDKPLDEWRCYMQDINFWLNGYLDSHAYYSLEEKLNGKNWVLWNVGVGPTCCFTRAISGIASERVIRRRPPFDPVIKVDMKRAAAVPAGTSLSISDKLVIQVAEQLGLLDQEYIRRKAEGDERWYYTYGLEGAYYSSEEIQRSSLDEADSLQELQRSIVPQINQKLSTKRYLLVVENLYDPIKPIQLDGFTEDLLCIPPPRWTDSFWLVSTTFQHVYDRSKPDYDCVIESFSEDDIVMLTLYSLHQAARYILDATGHKDEQYWHNVVVRCFHYATMLLIPHCSSAHGDEDQQSHSHAPDDITSDELIRQWVAQGLITVVQERTGEVTSASHTGKYNDIYQVGNVILEAFQEYSLLQHPFSCATNADEATKSAAHFLAFHNLIVLRLTVIYMK